MRVSIQVDDDEKLNAQDGTNSEHKSDEEDEEFADIIGSLNSLQLQDLALSARRGLSGISLAPGTLCTVILPPRIGSFNIVYEVSFSDGLRWAIRIPADDDVFSASAARSMHLDILAQNYISSNTTIPLPHIHAYSLDSNNKIGRPYSITDFLSGTNLSKLWNDNEWISLSKRKLIFEQLARWMTELATLEFDRIGRLDLDTTTGRHHIVPFPDVERLIIRREVLDPSVDKPIESIGPFDSSYKFIHDLLERRRKTDESPMLALLQLFVSALPDHALDGPPFTLFPPDLDTQNVLVADDGTITGLIDWDGVYVGPRQSGVAAYPSWLTADWDPTFYGWSKHLTADENSAYDSPTDLDNYRKMYVDAINRASSGTLTRVTRNSHVGSTLYIAVTNAIATGGIVDHLSKFVFGSSVLGYEVEEGIKGASWYRSRQSSDLIAQVAEETSDSEDETGC